MKHIKSKRNNDCLVCCLAMMLDISYAEAERYFPPIVVENEASIESEFLVDLVLKHCKETALSLFDFHVGGPVSFKIHPKFPAILQIKVSTPWDTEAFHALYWDGSKIFDPAKEKPHTEFPKYIWQLIINEVDESSIIIQQS